MTERIKFAKEWFGKGNQLLFEFEKTEEKGLLFEAYIYLWISLTIAAKEYCANDGKVFNVDEDRSSDKQEIEYWADKMHSKIIVSLINNKEDLLELSERKGTELGTPIIDTHGKNIGYYKDLSDYFQGNRRNKSNRQIVGSMIRILNQIRNNLFHGGKSFSSESDVELMRLTCTVLRDISIICINH